MTHKVYSRIILLTIITIEPRFCLNISIQAITEMDFIEVSGIRCYGYTGYLPEEQVLGQWFEVDLILGVDLKDAGISDNLDDTSDYRQAIAIVKNHIKTTKVALIEKLTEMIAQEILSLPNVNHVRIRLTKLAPPIPDFPGNITIDITRKKD
ncbi:dihydroneopterin aldolase [Crocosphaera subtropica ATCC 51142]|uniref:7,8-dihydroneopterin aldolase n=2 Tax=Crocosphaera TaxID=263510 RepID=B1WUB4_CROS5|nr:dihydroneopterin aldolase [Crocosphaera subtropica ATCC 51142]